MQIFFLREILNNYQIFVLMNHNHEINKYNSCMIVFKRELEFCSSYIRINIELIWNQQQLKD